MKNYTRLEMSGKGKKTMDKYFAPRTTRGVKPFIKSTLSRKKAIWSSNMATEIFFFYFFYDTCIPINTVNSCTSNQCWML